MSTALVGKWKLSSQENFDDFMKALGIGMANRMLAKAATPQVEISVAGSKWTILQTGLRDNSTTFELGVEMDHETTDGRKTKNVFSMDGDKLVQSEKWDGKEAKYVRQVVGDQLTATCTLGDVVCVRKYARV